MPRPARSISLQQISITVLLLFTVIFFTPALQAAKQVSANRECATCHIMWLTEFKRQDVKTLVPYNPKPVAGSGRQDVSSTEQMCFSCHDGFVLDSRTQWGKNKHAHPLGVPLAKNMPVATQKGKQILPLNDDGKVYCGTCHTAHGVKWDQTQQPIFMRMPSRNGELCMACHQDKRPHNSKHNHPINIQAKYKPLHLLAAGAKFGSNTTIVCQSCHKLHGATNKKILVTDNHNSDLCSNCHAEQSQVVGSKHDLSILDPQHKNRQGKTAGQSGPCSACHIPHGASDAPLWAGNDKQALPSAACISCHNPRGSAKEKLVNNEHGHPYGISVKKAGIAISHGEWHSTRVPRKQQPALKNLPLFTPDGKHAKNAELISCATCHDPHIWSSKKHRHPDAKKLTQLEGGPQDSFLRLPHDDKGSLCANCHVDKAMVISSKHNLSLSAPTAVNAQQQTTAQSGLCGSCHATHNNKHNLLWARSAQHSQSIDAMCRDCHSDTGMANDKQTGEYTHPVNVSLPKGMTTQLPLYDGTQHAEQSTGKLSCASCHDPHQWQAGQYYYHADVNPTVEGDASNSFLRLAASGRSRLCVSCHQSQGLVSGTDHDLSVTAPQAQNIHHQSVAHSGLCGQCHSPHNANAKQYLWARQPGQQNGNDPFSALCLSCHNNTQHALAGLPEKFLHPDKVQVWSQQLRTSLLSKNTGLPVFNENGIATHIGQITCLTCHNPHQWRPDVNKTGNGTNQEGDIRSSFLRLQRSDTFVCADCHGLDALYRYKYFHLPSSRVKYPLYR